MAKPVTRTTEPHNNGGVSEHRKTTDPATPPRGFRTTMVLFSTVAVIFALTAAYTTVSGDVWTANVASWQIVTHGNVWLDTIDFPQLDEHPMRNVWIVQLANGHEVIGRSPGAVAVALPAYALFGGDTFSLAPGAITAAILTAVSVCLVHATLRRQMNNREAVLAALIFGLTTPVWSVAANGVWPHTVTVLGLVGMAWAASTGRWWLVGVFGGIALWGRLHVAVIVAIVGLIVAWRRRDAGVVVRVGLMSGLFLVLQCVWTRWMYDSWNPMASYNTEPFEDFAGEHKLDVINHLGFWVSPDRGMLVWTPLLLVLLPAVIRNWRDLPDWSTALIWGGLFYTFLQGTLNRFSGGDAFYGYRLTLELLACLTPAFAFSAAKTGRRARKVFPFVLALQSAVALGAINNDLGTAAERVWYEHSLFTPIFSHAPALGLLCVPVVLLIGLLGSRIWADPGIKRREPTTPVSTGQKG